DFLWRPAVPSPHWLRAGPHQDDARCHARWWWAQSGAEPRLGAALSRHHRAGRDYLACLWRQLRLRDLQVAPPVAGAGGMGLGAALCRRGRRDGSSAVVAGFPARDTDIGWRAALARRDRRGSAGLFREPRYPWRTRLARAQRPDKAIAGAA